VGGYESDQNEKIGIGLKMKKKKSTKKQMLLMTNGDILFILPLLGVFGSWLAARQESQKR